MGEAKRRRAAMARLENITPQEARKIVESGGICAWAGCSNIYPGHPLPEGWRWLLLFWSPTPVQRIDNIPLDTWDRDAVLCPEHARALDQLLIPLMTKLITSPATGNG